MSRMRSKVSANGTKPRDNGDASMLGAINTRLSSASGQQLHHIVPALISPLYRCKDLLSIAAPKSNGSASSLQHHKLRTIITAYLGDGKSSDKRWAGLQLIKIYVDLRGPAALQDSATWIRGILNLLEFKRGRDSSTSRRLAIATLTNIFRSSSDTPSLAREVVTPSLPVFIGACLKWVEPVNLQVSGGRSATAPKDTNLLDSVLESFSELLPKHPTIFRPFGQRLRALLLELICPTSSDHNDTASNLSAASVAIAQSLFVILALVAPKNTAAPEWTRLFTSTIQEAHRTSDTVFRSIFEQWQSMTGYIKLQAEHGSNVQSFASRKDSELGLPPWKGVSAGCERLQGLLGLLKSYIDSEITDTVSFPLAELTDLLCRLLLIATPSGSPEENLRPNETFTQEERNAMFMQLPDIHIAALEVLAALTVRLGKMTLPVSGILFDHILWTFMKEKHFEDFRTQIYFTLSLLMENIGRSFIKAQSNALEEVIRQGCGDILPSHSWTNAALLVNGAVQQKAANTGDINIDVKKKSAHAETASNPVLQEAAQELLINVLQHIPSASLSTSTRTLLDRTAVLSGLRPAMLASVLNPREASSSDQRPPPSILPFLARAYPRSIETEAILRPRMPIISTISGMSMQDEHVRQESSEGLDPEDIYEHREDIEDMQKPPESYGNPDMASTQSQKLSTYRAEILPDPSKDQLTLSRDLSKRVDRDDLAIRDEVARSAITQLSERKRSNDTMIHVDAPPEKRTRANDTLDTDSNLKGADDAGPFPSVPVEDQRDENGGVDAEVAIDISDDDDELEVPSLVLRGDSDEDEDGDVNIED